MLPDSAPEKPRTSVAPRPLVGPLSREGVMQKARRVQAREPAPRLQPVECRRLL